MLCTSPWLLPWSWVPFLSSSRWSFLYSAFRFTGPCVSILLCSYICGYSIPYTVLVLDGPHLSLYAYRFCSSPELPLLSQSKAFIQNSLFIINLRHFEGGFSWPHLPLAMTHIFLFLFLGWWLLIVQWPLWVMPVHSWTVLILFKMPLNLWGFVYIEWWRDLLSSRV